MLLLKVNLTFFYDINKLTEASQDSTTAPFDIIKRQDTIHKALGRCTISHKKPLQAGLPAHFLPCFPFFCQSPANSPVYNPAFQPFKICSCQSEGGKNHRLSEQIQYLNPAETASKKFQEI